MLNPLKWHSVAIGLLVISTAGTAGAQEVATSFDQLRVLAKTGDTVTVKEVSGREVTGKIANLSSSTLEVVPATGQRRTFDQDDVKTISQSRHGDLGRGARWGFGIGAAFATVMGLASVSSCHYGCSEYAALIPVAAALYGGIGSGIGVGISASISSQRTIFSNTDGFRRVTLAPVVTQDRKAMLVSVGF
jgi:hypothetical protein